MDQPSASPKTAPVQTSVFLVIVLGLLTATGPFAIDLYLPALPTIAAEFGTSTARIEHSVASFFIGLGIGQFVYGPMSDRMGRRAPLLAGLLLFVVASLALAFAPDTPMLIAGRFLQAFGACAGMVIGRAVVRDIFDTQESARMFSLLMLVVAVAPMLAPSIGAQLLAHFGWRSIFFALTGFAILAMLLSLFGLPETLSAANRQAARQENPWQSYAVALRNREVLGFLLCSVGNSGAMIPYLSGSAGLFIDHYGLSPQAFGSIFTFNAIGLIIATQVNRHMLKTRAALQILRWFTTLSAAIAMVLLALTIVIDVPLWLCVGLIFLSLSCYGFISTNGLALALAAMPERAGAISAMIGGAAFLFGAAAAGIASVVLDGGPLTMAASLAAGFAISWLSLFLVVGRKRYVL